MFGLNNQDLNNENIRNLPSEDSFPILTTLFESKHHEITINSLSLTILELIDKNQIKCEITWDDSHTVGKKLTQTDMEVMKNITFRIANSGELKTSESLAINLLKSMNKNKKFTLKDMIKQGNTPAIADKFQNDFIKFRKAVENENEFSPENYRDILAGGKLTDGGKKLKKAWGDFKKYLSSKDLTEKYPPQTAEENSSQIIYAACFNIEKDALALRQNNSTLTDFIDKDGYKLLNIIFNNTLSHVTEKRKGDGIFYGVNDKYTIPGGA